MSHLTRVALLVLLFGVTTARIIDTYSYTSATRDEPFGVGCGLEWYELGKYTYEWHHPPLSRLAIAFFPYVAGLRTQPNTPPNHQGLAALKSSGDFHRSLNLARLGNLVFLPILMTVVYLISQRWFHGNSWFWSILLLVSLPLLLAHSSLATLDFGCTATFTAAFYCLLRWVEKRSIKNSIILGLSLGAAFMTKLSNIPFLGACVVAMLLYGFLTRSLPLADYPARLRSNFPKLTLVLFFLLLFLWATYRFSFVPLALLDGKEAMKTIHPTIDRTFANSPILHKLAYWFMETPLPLQQVIGGLVQVRGHIRMGHPAYLLGDFSNHGWWYYFPITVAVKTPVGFLILSFCSIALILSRFRTLPWQQVVIAASTVSIFVMCLFTSINIGLRYLLPIFPLLAVASGHLVALTLSNPTRRPLGLFSAALACSVFVNSIQAHPHYIPYFNFFAGSQPERIIVDSDLDWGQDLFLLRDRLKSLGVKKIYISYFGATPLETAGLPDYELLPEFEEVKGYVAISIQQLTTEQWKTGHHKWLNKYQPIEKIGSSIMLYNLQ